MQERIISSSPQPEDRYSDLIVLVERFRDTKGDGGCFMEVLQKVTKQATLANIFRQQGLLNDKRFAAVMTGLNEIIDSLPPLQTDQALEEAFAKLDRISGTGAG